MKTKSLHLIVGLLLLGCTSNHDSGKTKFMVGIVADQMRQDYLYLFQFHFGEHGFKRFYNEGFVAKNHHFDYQQTKTGPGYASIATGTPPAINGIIAMIGLISKAENTATVLMTITFCHWGQQRPRAKHLPLFWFPHLQTRIDWQSR
jgi:hypothetical protein